MKKLISYDSEVILTFIFACVGVWIVGHFVPSVVQRFFVVRGSMSWSNPMDYVRLVSYVFGHANIQHLYGNMILILFIGPALEEKYGSVRLFFMILATAIITGIINVTFFSSGLLGASGIVFMLIILGSIVRKSEGTIPLTFILAVVFFMGKEVYAMFEADNVSQMAHLIGGACGAMFGFGISKTRKSETEKEPEKIDDFSDI